MEERRFSAATSGAQSIRASAQRYLVVMDPEQDTEITLGTAKLLSLFFGLVVICAVFFALGYTLGRKTDAGVIASSAAPLQTSSNGLKPAGSASPQPAPPMTFYKAVEQKDANPQLTPASSDANSPNPAATAEPASSSPTSSSGTSSPGTRTQASSSRLPARSHARAPHGRLLRAGGRGH